MEQVKNILLPIEYDEIKNVYAESTYIAKQSGSWKIVNVKDNTSTDLNYDDVKSMDSSNMVVVKGGKYGIATFSRRRKSYTTIDSLKNIYQNYYIAQKDGKTRCNRF